jgi:hypothetical protein
MPRRTWAGDLTGPALAFGLAGLLTLLFYAPMLIEVQAFFVRGSDWARAASAGWAIGEALRGLRIGYSGTAVLLVGGLVFLAGCWSYFRQSVTVLALFFVPAGVLLVIGVLVNRPIFPRFFFFLAGFGLLVLVRGLFLAADAMARLLPATRRAGARAWIAGTLVGGAAVVSALTLPAAYRLPKQDYAGALRYLEAAMSPDDTVLLAGVGTAEPYRRYYGKPWRRVREPAELTADSRPQRTVWLLYTLQTYIETLEPDLMRAIRAHCVPVRSFPGTVGGGHIVVARCAASQPG